MRCDVTSFLFQALGDQRCIGNVTTELQASGDSQGRISYENRGECFFLPYTKDDVEGNVTLRAGDKVSFQIATNQRYVLSTIHTQSSVQLSALRKLWHFTYVNANFPEETWVRVT